ncbi:tripartite tricarboxylate transporter substrate binding protein [Xylophilus sp. GOD-11R]|uniref:Bug family tripartite tricarboxylate transporter substrate binding protein n=1 Tax=Xylophilus sp. GOD-11R TaxID=3089814 RepID=UPI00298CF016|nr:tripartite tricarboxylate transporter substrate binding protein [Xylophilus sp. GOD-11R]WPB55431.1 tripartite tricarboxylate transporter substrate binding protein [Xylophilus sp. GOD-11R]
MKRLDTAPARGFFAPDRRGLLQAGLACVCAASGIAQAQTPFPSRPIRLVVPFGTGGVTDTSARLIADKLGQVLGQPVVVDNRAGAAGNIGTQQVAQSDPDGYTLLLGYDGTMVVNPNVYAKVPFDPIKDFAPIGKIGNAVLVIVVNPQVPAHNFQELMAWGKSQPGGISFGTSGTGSTTHLAGESLKQRTGIPLVHVPYKGGGQALTDVVGGVLPMLFPALAGAAPFIKSGQVRAIAVSSAERTPAFPEIPTLLESGVKDFVFDSWVGLLAPAKTPRPVVDRLDRALQEVLRMPDTRERLAALGIVATPGTPQEYGRQIAYDLDRYKAIVKTANIRID